jgi:hypothetical protein
MFVLHRCDNPPCCNPAHLFIGDAEDNSKDMWTKSRGVAFPESQQIAEAEATDAL